MERDYDGPSQPSPNRNVLTGAAGAYSGESAGNRFAAGTDPHPRALLEREMQMCKSAEAGGSGPDRIPMRVLAAKEREAARFVADGANNRYRAAGRVLDVLEAHPYLEQFIYDLQTLGILR